MNRLNTVIALAIVCPATAFVICNHAIAQAPPASYAYTIARPQDRAWIKSLPIELRPDRPLHFYGNRVRSNYRTITGGNAPLYARNQRSAQVRRSPQAQRYSAPARRSFFSPARR